MPEQPLFQDQPRGAPGIKRAAETSFQFLQRVDDPVFDRVRSVFNDWFGRFVVRQTKEAVDDLRGRFGSRQENQFYSAFWELYLHEILVRLGFEVHAHPEGPRTTRPDFVAHGEHGHFYVEAVMPTPATGEKQPKSVATVLEYVDAAFNPDFYLAVRFVSAGAETPKRKMVVGKVEQWLAGFRWDEFRNPSGMRQPGPEAEIAIDDWMIGLEAIPRPPNARGDRSFPTIGFYPGGAAWVEAVVAATGPTLDEKASKYGDLDAPYVLAAWVMSPLASESSLAYALFVKAG